MVVDARAKLAARLATSNNDTVHNRMTNARTADAYHEAGHAVMAYHVGWSLDLPGVEIDERQHTSVEPQPAEWAPWRYAYVALAGPFCEARYAGRTHPLRTDARRLDSIGRARDWLASGTYEGDQSHDGVQAAAMLLTVAPEAADDKIVAVLNAYESEIWEVISAPDFWSRVERVAAALIERGHLDPYTVRSLL